MATISAEDPHPRKRVAVEGSEMSYVDTGGEGPIAVFMHGNPTSSYLWRNVIKEVAPVARCLAPDLIGMGDSGESSSGYRFIDHRRYLDAWFDAVVGNQPVFLVVHDWGSGLGFHWARRHPEQVKGIAYMEAIVRPIESWEDWSEPARKIFQAMRSPAGEEIVLTKNVFVERILPSSIIRKLSDEEMNRYRARFTEPGESRRPTLTWPRELPIGGEPKDVHEIAEGRPRHRLDRPPTRVRAAASQPGRDHGEGAPLHSGGFAHRDWRGGRSVRTGEQLSATATLRG